MRVIRLDSTPILSMLSTSNTDFALWVKVSENDVPDDIQVIPKGKLVGLKFVYGEEGRVWTKEIGKSRMYCMHGSNRIAGFDVPVGCFHREVQNLVMWLRQEQRNINAETVRNNYRIIASFLQMRVMDMFCPPQ